LGGRFDAAAFLGAQCGFNQGDLQAFRQGRAVARTVGADSDEAAICAAIEMNVPARFYLDRFRQIETFKRADGVLQIGRFSASPTAADLRGLSFSDHEINDLRDCREGNCDFKLDAAGIRRVHDQVDFSARDARTRAERVVREHLAEYVARYLREGDAALMTYADAESPRGIHGDLQRILERSTYLSGDLRRVVHAVGDFTGRVPDGAESFVYWSKERVGPRSVISITHVLILTPQPGLRVLTSKQIYANHYFRASLGLALVAERAPDHADGLAVIYLNRSLVNAFDGMLGGVKRSVARPRARAAVERLLRGLATRLETAYKAGESTRSD
jgi:hypothetical protein